MQTISPSSSSKKSLLSWWYELTAIPEPRPTNSTFAKRETSRKSRFLSVIVGCLLVSFFVFIPGCLVLPNHYVIVADLGMMPVCVIALVLNKFRKPVVAGTLLTIAFEAALTMVVLTSVPFDPPTLQQYELFVFGEILAVSLLAPKSVWLVAAYNIGFIIWSLLYQPYKDAALLYELHTQFAAILVRPVAVQFVVAGVTHLWVSGAIGAILRADTAEVRTQLEIQKRELEEARFEEERVYQEFVQRIVQEHANAMNHGAVSIIPIKQYPPLFLPLINVYNSLQHRVQRERRTDEELQKLRQALLQTAERAQQGLNIPTTGTLVDVLVSALVGQGQISQKRGETAGKGNDPSIANGSSLVEVAQQPTQEIQRERIVPPYQPFDR